MNSVNHFIPKYIKDTPIGISLYSVSQEATHYHTDVYELIYCLNGTVTVISGYELITVSKGELLGINCNEVHGIYSDGPNLIASFYIDMSYPFYNMKNLPSFMMKVTPGIEDTFQSGYFKELKDLLLSALYIYTGNYETDANTFIKIAQQTTQLMHNHFSVFFSSEYDEDSEWSKERFENILLYINSHYNEKITLKLLSEMENLNPNYLSVYFNKIFEDTFHNYLAVIRIYRSEIELLTTKHLISDVAYNCGFSNPKFYYKAFKQWYGRTPVNHRKWHKEYNLASKSSRNYHVNEIRHTIQQYIVYYFSKSQLDACNIPIPSINMTMSKDRSYSEWRSY